MALIIWNPGPGPSSIARLAWTASRCLLDAARAGRRAEAEHFGLWLANTAASPLCRPALARCIDGSLAAARRMLGGGPNLTPVQPDDGACA